MVFPDFRAPCYTPQYRVFHHPAEACTHQLCPQSKKTREPYVNLRSCCNSYFSFASSSIILFPSSLLTSSVVSETALCTSSIAPVCLNQPLPFPEECSEGFPTNITGHRSLAEIYAKEVLSEVKDWAVED